MEKAKTIDLLKEGTLLPPAADKCQECARKHDPEQPHDPQSLYYQMWFRKQHDRWPTWKDALAHCPAEVRKIWIESLKNYGVTVE